jgi:hypothetical protein
VAGDPFFTRLTARRRVEVNLIPPQINQLTRTQPMAMRDDDHGRVPMPQRLCFAAAVSRSISPSVRYSLVLRAMLALRRGTVRFSMRGLTNLSLAFAIGFNLPCEPTVRTMIQNRTVSKCRLGCRQWGR